MSIALIAALLLWGTFVAVDLVTVPQGLFSRPLVSATVAGAMAGDVSAGLLAGVVLELYALEVMPIGASRYPDWGPAAMAAGATAALVPGAGRIGVAGLIALPLALVGGWSMLLHRRRTARAITGMLDRVAAGDARAVWHLQREGLWRDTLRGVVLSTLGVVMIGVAGLVPWTSIEHLGLLDVAVLGGGLAAALGGAIRSAGSGARRRWLAVGAAAGLVVVLWP